MTTTPTNDWTSGAACKGTSTAIWYPAAPLGRPSKNGMVDMYQRARQICDSCPVVVECLTACLAEEDANYQPGALVDRGFRGGKTPHERAAAIRERRTLRRQQRMHAAA